MCLYVLVEARNWKLCTSQNWNESWNPTWNASCMKLYITFLLRWNCLWSMAARDLDAPWGIENQPESLQQQFANLPLACVGTVVESLPQNGANFWLKRCPTDRGSNDTSWEVKAKGHPAGWRGHEKWLSPMMGFDDPNWWVFPANVPINAWIYLIGRSWFTCLEEK